MKKGQKFFSALSFFEVVLLVGSIGMIAYFSLHFFKQHFQIQKNEDGIILGEITSFHGHVQIKAPGSFIWIEPSAHTPLVLGDSLRTGPDSAAKILVNNKTMNVESSSLIVFKSNNKEGPDYQLVFGQIEDQEGKALLQPKTETKPEQQLPANQSLWWILPDQDHLWLSENDRQIKISWGGNFLGPYHLRLSSDGKLIEERTVNEFETHFDDLESGSYQLEISPDELKSYKLSRSIFIQDLVAPVWKVHASELTQNEVPKLVWTNRMKGRSEIEIHDDEKTLWHKKLEGTFIEPPKFSEPPFANKSLVALVRTRLPNGKVTPWSEPLVFRAPSQMEKTELVFDKNSVELIPKNEHEFSCRQNVKWRLPHFQNQLSYEMQYQNTTVFVGKILSQKIKKNENIFCPPLPGSYQIVLFARDSSGRQVGESLPIKIEATLQNPIFQEPGLLSVAKDDYLLKLKSEAGFSLETSFHKSATEPNQFTPGTTLTDSTQLITLPKEVDGLRVRYRTSQGQILSGWSQLVPVIKPPKIVEHKPMKKTEPLPDDVSLVLKPNDSGPVYTSELPNGLWADLRWSSNSKALYYEIELSVSGKFTGEQTKKKLKINHLYFSFDHSNEIYWRVRANSTLGLGPWTSPIVAHSQSINSQGLATAVPAEQSSGRRRVRAPADASQSPQKKKSKLPQDPKTP